MLIKNKKEEVEKKMHDPNQDSNMKRPPLREKKPKGNAIDNAEDYIYKIYELYKFDIRNAEQRQNLFRHLKIHKLLMEIIMYISNPNQIHFN